MLKLFYFFQEPPTEKMMSISRYWDNIGTKHRECEEGGGGIDNLKLAFYTLYVTKQWLFFKNNNNNLNLVSPLVLRNK